MALTLINLSGFQRGVAEDETGINIESFEVRYFPAVKEKLNDKQGEPRGFAVSDKFSREITVQGEISGATGLMAATLVAATTLANDVDDFGDGTGGIWMDEATVSQGREAWKNLNMRMSSDPGIPAPA